MTRNKDVQIACRITEEQAKKLKIACAMQETTIQNVLEQAVLEFIEKNYPNN